MLFFRIQGYKNKVISLAHQFSSNRNSLLDNINKGMPDNSTIMRNSEYLFSVIRQGPKYFKNFVFKKEKPSEKLLSSFLPLTSAQLEQENFVR